MTKRRYSSIDDLLTEVITRVGRAPSVHDPRSIAVQGKAVVFVNVRPRRGRDSAWNGINIGVITLDGDQKTVTSLSTPRGVDWKQVPTADLDDLVDRATSFIRQYVARLEADERTP